MRNARVRNECKDGGWLGTDAGIQDREKER